MTDIRVVGTIVGRLTRYDLNNIIPSLKEGKLKRKLWKWWKITPEGLGWVVAEPLENDTVDSIMNEIRIIRSSNRKVRT